MRCVTVTEVCGRKRGTAAQMFEHGTRHTATKTRHPRGLARREIKVSFASHESGAGLQSRKASLQNRSS
jgi:hypothetical protein